MTIPGNQMATQQHETDSSFSPGDLVEVSVFRLNGAPRPPTLMLYGIVMAPGNPSFAPVGTVGRTWLVLVEDKPMLCSEYSLKACAS